jgi:hypothetical protein
MQFPFILSVIETYKYETRDFLFLKICVHTIRIVLCRIKLFKQNGPFYVAKLEEFYDVL